MRGHGRARTHRGSSHPAGAWPQARGPAPDYPRRPSQPRSGRCGGEANAQWNHEKKTCPRQVPEQARCAIGPPWQGDLAPRRGARAIRVAVGGAIAHLRARFPRGPMLASRSPRPICRWAPHEPNPTVFEPFSSAPTPAPARVAGQHRPIVRVGARQHRHGRRDPQQPDFPNATRDHTQWRRPARVPHTAVPAQPSLLRGGTKPLPMSITRPAAVMILSRLMPSGITGLSLRY